jgi:hypothetical protein
VCSALQDYLGGGSDVGEEDGDEDDERLRYERELDESLERSYRLYLQRKGHREEMAKVREEGRQGSKAGRAHQGNRPLEVGLQPTTHTDC